MTAEQKKAKELIEKFYVELKEHKGYYDEETARQCAIMCVDEVLSIIRYHGTDIGEHSLLFWQKVKQEIINYK